jgi:hypothetical protein
MDRRLGGLQSWSGHSINDREFLGSLNSYQLLKNNLDL